MTLHRTTQHAWWLSIAMIFLVAVPRVAFAHAHLVRSAPAADAHLQTSPTLIQLWFSEAAEASMTKITVSGSNGAHALIGPVGGDASNPLLLTAAITSPLPAGEYTVSWRTIAKDDGHPAHGTFKFVVEGTAAPATGPSGLVTPSSAAPTGGSAGPEQPAAGLRGASATNSAAGAVQGMDVEAPAYIIARWLNFAAIIVVIGVVAFYALIIPRVIAQDGADRVASFAERATRGAASLGLAAGVTAVIAAFFRLFAERAVIGMGISMATVLQSSWGRTWLLQLGIAAVLCVALALARFSERTSYRNMAWLAAAVAALALGASPALSGHAIAAPEHRNISVALDALHVLAAGGWIGGLFVLAAVGVPAALAGGENVGKTESITLIARLANAFSPAALVFAAIVVVSGGVAAWLRVGSLARLFDSTYGTVLLIKLGFVVLVLAGGAFNWLRMRAVLSRREPDHSVLGAFRRSAWAELAAAMLVVAATAVLVAVQPPVY
jgi:copper transport protein